MKEVKACVPCPVQIRGLSTVMASGDSIFAFTLFRFLVAGGVENLEAACRDYERVSDMVSEEKHR